MTAAWGVREAKAGRLPTLFLEQGRTRTIALPASAYDPTTSGCTSVALLTGRSTDFVAQIDPVVVPKHHPTGGQQLRSLAGTVMLVRCGQAKASLARLSVELRVARAALEVIVAEGPSPAPPVDTILPERASGPLATPGDAGPPLPLEPMQTRAARADARARRSGATSIRHVTLTPDVDGTGREVLHLDEGCHRVELFSDPAGRRRVDLDAELRDAATERLLARDRADSPDARLDLCLGDRAALDLAYAGAAGPVPVLVSDAAFAIPSGIPTRWGARARAGIAAALRRRAMPEVRQSPDREMLGVGGVTTIPVEVEPGACYVAAVGVTRGEARVLTLSVRAAERTRFDSNGGLLDGTAVAFCATDTTQATLEVEARGGSVAWVLSTWRVGAVALGDGP